MTRGGVRLIDVTVEELRAIVREEVERIHGGDMLTPAEAATVARVHVQTVRDWLRQGLPAKTAGKRKRIRRADLDAWLQKGKSAAHLKLIGGR